ncbi:MAG: PDZ domain-containing protein, partial [Pseudomonadota bacterium]|nr:PDZ domain-containing protein [Pseudomonadota bacterium]
GLELTQVYHDESAYEAGLSANDRLIAIDHLQVTSDNINEILDAFKPGDSVTVHAFRRDELRTLKLTWQAPKKTSYVLSITQPEHLNNWLKTSP